MLSIFELKFVKNFGLIVDKYDFVGQHLEFDQFFEIKRRKSLQLIQLVEAKLVLVVQIEKSQQWERHTLNEKQNDLPQVGLQLIFALGQLRISLSIVTVVNFGRKLGRVDSFGLEIGPQRFTQIHKIAVTLIDYPTVRNGLAIGCGVDFRAAIWGHGMLTRGSK